MRVKSKPKEEEVTKLVRREVNVPVTAETFDIYVRSVAQIAAEAGISRELTVEALMAYGLALPEADELIHGFLRGDLTLFPAAEENRRLVERDTRRLELESTASSVPPKTPLGRKLGSRPGSALGRADSETLSVLDGFVRRNPEVYRQVNASSHEFLVRWVMLYLMEAAQARERVHRIAHEFWAKFPGHHQRLAMTDGRQSRTRYREARARLGNNPTPSEFVRP